MAFFQVHQCQCHEMMQERNDCLCKSRNLKVEKAHFRQAKVISSMIIYVFTSLMVQNWGYYFLQICQKYCFHPKRSILDPNGYAFLSDKERRCTLI